MKHLLSLLVQLCKRTPLSIFQDMSKIQVRPNISDTIEKKGMDGWELLYQMQQTPWDLGSVTPAIKNLVKEGGIPPVVRRILVPGCGVGYDVMEFASSRGDAQVVGLDLSTSAIQAAKDMARKGDPAIASRVEWVQGDFYSYSPKDIFDLVFDYTFLCAMQLHMRPNWAQKMSELVRPGCYLLTLIYPISDHEGGPPFALNPQIYHDLLDGTFEMLWMRDCESAEFRKGREKLALWKRLQF